MSTVADKPAEMVPAALGTVAAAGVLWRGTEERAVNSSGQPFVEVDLLYGDLEGGRSRTPYDAFTMRIRLGGGVADQRCQDPRPADRPAAAGWCAPVQRGAVLRLPGQRRLRLRCAVVRGHHRTCSTRSRRASACGLLGAGGLTVLGAINSLPPGVFEAPDEEVDPDAPQGVSEGPRYYDYGPGSNFSGAAILTRDRDIVAAFLYEGRHLYSLDGVRANHFLQHIRADLKWPLRGPLGLGASGEYFSRHTYFQDAARTETRILVSAVSRFPDVESPMRRDTTICACGRTADPVVAGDRRRPDGGGRCRVVTAIANVGGHRRRIGDGTR